MRTRTTSGIDRRHTLLVLWIFVTLNYIYCDVLGLMHRGYLQDLLAGDIGGLELTPGFLLAASLLVEVPMAMVLLSWVLPHRASRIASIVAGSLMTLVQIGSLSVGSGPTPSYWFFSVIEIVTTAFIVWFAWTWREE